MSDKITMGGIFGLPEGGRYRKLYYAYFKSGHDLMAMTYDSPIGPGAVLRTRTYHSDEPFDSDDRKAIFRLTPTDQTPEEVDQTVDRIFGSLHDDLSKAFGEPEIDITDVFGEAERLLEVLSTKPWSHMKVLKPGETPEDLGFTDDQPPNEAKEA